MAKFIEKVMYWIYQYLPCIIAGLSFLPCGLVYGYEITAFVVERNNRTIGTIDYGPMMIGAACALILSMAMFITKYIRGRFSYMHLEILITAAVFNVIASIFYFVNNFDLVGAFISFVAHALTFIAALSYLHLVCGKSSRVICISACFSWYLLGLSSAVSLIGSAYHSNIKNNVDDPAEGIYVNFAAVYLSLSVVILAIFIGTKLLDYFGNIDYKNIMDNDFRIANSNGTVFDKREDILKRIQFFYVTKNRQWFVTTILLFLDGIDYSMFIYFVFWFSVNSKVALTDENHIAIMFWIIFAGSVVALILVRFVSIKTNFVASKIIQIMLTFLCMIIFGSIGSKAPFWILLFFFGVSFSNIKIFIIETSHFKYIELLIFVSYFFKLLTTCIVYFYFVANSSNSYFYSTDKSTLMAQAFVFLIITSLITIIISQQVPRTFKTSLFDIQYSLLGVIFKKHQIEQLNMHWLNDGTIPTITRTQQF